MRKTQYLVWFATQSPIVNNVVVRATLTSTSISGNPVSARVYRDYNYCGEDNSHSRVYSQHFPSDLKEFA